MVGHDGFSTPKKSSGFSMARYTKSTSKSKGNCKAPQPDVQPFRSGIKISEQPPQHNHIEGRSPAAIVKLKEKKLVVKNSYKRPRSVNPSLANLLIESSAAGGQCYLSVEFDKDDNAFDNLEVAKRFGHYSMIQKDFDQLLKSTSQNVAETILHTYKAFVHLLKAEQDMKKYNKDIMVYVESNRKLSFQCRAKKTND
ncbi:uncharacterized protein LOC111286214 [Durio zibethinus]|uniref:Uncharacterized protein LOC111286214 n=1 Tax=Durio zibethinus TaxID=66656 RepID=A0A6P5XUZ4_DURZI|nr:uncharacterized protein LOC111286214 [Durio zibethinus]